MKAINAETAGNAENPVGSGFSRILRPRHRPVEAGLYVLIALLAVVTVSAQRGAPARPAAQPFTVVEASIADMRTAMEQKRITSRQIVTEYLARIATYDN